jgi:hypothetical protein
MVLWPASRTKRISSRAAASALSQEAVKFQRSGQFGKVSEMDNSSLTDAIPVW